MEKSMKLSQEKIKAAMNKKGISKYQLFDLMGISESSYYKWLRGGFPIVACDSIHVKLGVEQGALCHG